MTYSNYSNYRWCDTSGHWHDGYPASGCNYSQVEGCNTWGSWHDCTPKRDGYVDGTSGNDLIDYAYTGDPQGDKIDHSDAVLSGAAPNDDYVRAGAGNDTVLAGLGSDKVYGGDGNDVIDSSTGSLADQRPDIGYPGLYAADTDVNNDRDTVDGGAGNDTIRTGDDADSIDGGTGNDSIDAGVDNDTVLGGDGNDTIIGAEGSDCIDAGTGDDLVYGGYGPGVPDSVNIPDATDLAPNNGLDSIHGGSGNDTLFGMDDNDKLYGDSGNDSLDGGIDNDTLFGGTGNDTAAGGEGKDKIYGEEGDDRITGGTGADTLSGGDDRDTFVSATDGDAVNGDEGGVDYDTLDLTGAGPFHITYDPANPENGTVNFLDPTDHHVVGTMTFANIENVIPCFTPGTLIATPRGEVAVEELRVGDKIITRDNGMQEIRWLGRRDLSWSDLAAAPHLKPILVRQG